jgi:hypothetical protein
MPDFTYKVIVTLVRGTTELKIARESHSLYIGQVMQLVYHMSKEFLANGYAVKRYELEDFRFINPKQDNYG